MKRRNSKASVMADRITSVRPKEVRDYAAEIGMELVPANRQAAMAPQEANKYSKLGMSRSNRSKV